MDRLLYYVFAGTRGGPTRARIVHVLLDAPTNAHQVAVRLGLDYKTVEYNLRVLAKHRYVVVAGPEGYGQLYAPSRNLLAVEGEFRSITLGLGPAPAQELGKTSNNPDAGGDRE